MEIQAKMQREYCVQETAQHWEKQKTSLHLEINIDSSAIKQSKQSIVKMVKIFTSNWTMQTLPEHLINKNIVKYSFSWGKPQAR